MRTLTEVAAVTQLLVMVQREVGERMAAEPGHRAYGSVSVRIAYFARAQVIGPRAGRGLRSPASGRISPGSPRAAAGAGGRSRLVSYDRLAEVVRAGFAQRRKMLRRSLAGVVEPDAFVRAGVRPDARAEELDVAAWGRLAAT